MMVKLQDFAKECGVTDRTIQKHVQKHEEALEGHFERRGPNGTWLDEYAQDFIRGLMIQPATPVIGDARTVRENEELRQALLEKDAKIQAQKEFIDRLLAENGRLQGNTARLEASEQAKALLEAQNAQHRQDADNARLEAASARQETKEVTRELLASQDDNADLRIRLAAEEAKVASLKNRTAWQRLTRYGE